MFIFQLVKSLLSLFRSYKFWLDNMFFYHLLLLYRFYFLSGQACYSAYSIKVNAGGFHPLGIF